MNQKSKFWKILTFICWVLVLTSGMIVVGYYYIDRINYCTRDPFNYGIENLKEKLDIDDVGITMSLMKNNNAIETYIYINRSFQNIREDHAKLQLSNFTFKD